MAIPAPSDGEMTMQMLAGNPPAAYRRLRRMGPVVHLPQLGRYIAVKYAAAKAIKTNDAVFRSDDRPFTHKPAPMLRAMNVAPAPSP